MTLATAVRLGRRGRGSGPWARWARQRLLRAGDRGETVAIYQLWDLWLDAPDDEVWAALSRWHVPKVADKLTEVALGGTWVSGVVEALRRVGHPIADIARATVLAGNQKLVDGVCEAATTDDVIAAFCLEHQLAPSDAHRAAVYFLLTGQREQYRHVDPDHSLLTVAYQAAGEGERSRIRARVIGEPDLVRVLATAVGRGRLTRLGRGEADYLVARFAERRDWPGLWELAKELPVLDAAAAVRRFDDWRPDGPNTTLFDALAAADPDQLTRSHAAVARGRHMRLPVNGTGEGSISPDGRRIVVGDSSSVQVFTIPDDGEPRLEAQKTTRHRCEVLALDDAVVINHWDRQRPPAGFTENGYVPDDDSESGIYQVTKGASFDRIAGGFAALAATDSREGRLLHLVSGSGPDLAGYDHRVLDLAAELGLSPKVAGAFEDIATDPESGLIAFAGKDLYLARITPQGLQRLATAPFNSGLHPTLQFSGQDRLTTMDDDRILRVWRVEEGALEVVAERKIAGARPVDLPAGGVIAMSDMSSVGAGRRQVRYVDRETLIDVPTRDRFNRLQDTFGVFASPDGTWLGVHYWDGVDITEVGFAELAFRPLAATTPADLHTVRTRLADTPATSTARPFLELLRTCLEHRFGTDIALGDDRLSPWRPDDISLRGTT